MTLDRDTALTSLTAIEQAEQRTTQAIFYGNASAFLILWGVLTAGGYAFGQFWPRHAQTAWLLLRLIGSALTVVLILRRQSTLTSPDKSVAGRIVAAQVALVGFGILFVLTLGPFSGRQLDAFWPLAYSLGYVLAGIWVGRFFILCGVAIALLTVAGFSWSGSWFPLWMAAVNGGGLILGGLWLRWKGAEP